MEHTAKETAKEELVDVVVSEIVALSPTVKGYTLRVQDSGKMNFTPGQWIDMHIPYVEDISGYSITSHPAQLCKEGIFKLAIQYTAHTVTSWMHSQCRVGTQLKVKVGGQFCCKEYDDGVGLLLVAGGIGINPIYSMLQEYTSTLTSSPHIHMLYTATSMEELLFKNDLDALIADNVKITYFVTRQPVQSTSNVHSRRMTQSDISTAVKQLQSSSTSLQCYVCGPPSLVSFVVDTLKHQSIPEQSINYEQWW